MFFDPQHTSLKRSGFQRSPGINFSYCVPPFISSRVELDAFESIQAMRPKCKWWLGLFVPNGIVRIKTGYQSVHFYGGNMLKHSYLVLSAFLISSLPWGPSWGQVPQTQPTQAAVTQSTQLAVTLESMDDVSRQIGFSFNEKVIPEVEDLKAILHNPPKDSRAEGVTEKGLQGIYKSLKESLLSKKKKVLSDDEMDELLGKRNATEADMRLMIDKIKAYIISKISFLSSLNGSFVWNDPQHLVFIPEPNQINLWENQIDVKVSPIRPYFGKEFTSNALSQSL